MRGQRRNNANGLRHDRALAAPDRSRPDQDRYAEVGTVFRRRKMGARIVMMIHDALWIECPEDEAEQVRHLVRRIMTTAARLCVPLFVDVE